MRPDLWPWEERRVERDWERAEALFHCLVDYPAPFLSALLQAFRRGSYEDGDVITTKNWAENCRAGREKIAVDLGCVTCEAVHEGSMRLAE